MDNNYKCWKIAEVNDETQEPVLRLDGVTYTLQSPDEIELENARKCIDNLCIERKYKTQVAGLGQVYYDMKSEKHDLKHEELIFNDNGICIGIYHDELVFMIYDKDTYHRKKYLGEMPTGPDRSIEFYDYYTLLCK